MISLSALRNLTRSLAGTNEPAGAASSSGSSIVPSSVAVPVSLNGWDGSCVETAPSRKANGDWAPFSLHAAAVVSHEARATTHKYSAARPRDLRRPSPPRVFIRLLFSTMAEPTLLRARARLLMSASLRLSKENRTDGKDVAGLTS